jgi:hypothetical protein
VTVNRSVDVFRAVRAFPATDDDLDSKDWPNYFPFDNYHDLGCDPDCMDFLVSVVASAALLTPLPGNRFREGLWPIGRATSSAWRFRGRIFPRMCIPAVLLVYSMYVLHLNAIWFCADLRKQMMSKRDSQFSI